MKLDIKTKKIISLCLMGVLVVGFILIYYSGIEVKKDGIIEIKSSLNPEYSGYIFKSQSDFNYKFSDVDDVKLDFNNHNYVLAQINYDTCSERDLRVDKYELLGGNQLRVTVSYEALCGVCPGETLNYLLEVDKSVEYITVDYKYLSRNTPHCDPNVAYKPLIYLYPESTTNVSIKLSNPSFLTTVYPKYNDGWNVTAYSDGKLVDNNTGRKLYGLYWEGNNHYASVQDDGFIIKGEDSSKFLEEKLELLGLNEYEAEEFIVYWLPKLEANKYNYIRFESIDEINNYMGLDIEPKPDTVIRVLMDYKPLDKPIKVKEQKIVTPERVGFTVVEWGGALIK